jgi:hypothetical protein
VFIGLLLSGAVAPSKRRNVTASGQNSGSGDNPRRPRRR